MTAGPLRHCRNHQQTRGNPRPTSPALTVPRQSHYIWPTWLPRLRWENVQAHAQPGRIPPFTPYVENA